MSQRKPFLLRLDPELHRALQRWADDELRSLNGQIEFLLRDACRRARRLSEQAVEAKRRPAGVATDTKQLPENDKPEMGPSKGPPSPAEPA